MKRQIVAPETTLSHIFRVAAQQNPDASLSDLLETLANREKLTVIELLGRIKDVTMQDLKNIKSPNFDDPAIAGEVDKMITKITEFLKESKASEDKWEGKTRSEIEKGVNPVDHLEAFALEEGWRRMEDDHMIASKGGTRRGEKFELAEVKPMQQEEQAK